MDVDVVEEPQDINHNGAKGFITFAPVSIPIVIKDCPFAGVRDHRFLAKVIPLGVKQCEETKNRPDVDGFRVVLPIANSAPKLGCLNNLLQPLEPPSEILQGEFLYLVACVARS